MPRHIRKDDLVYVKTGGGRSGKRSIGKVMSVIRGKTPDQDRVLVEGVNLRKKNVKPSAKNQQGGVIQKEMSIHISNVAHVIDGKPTRVRFEKRPDGSKVRLAVRGGGQLGPPLRKPAS